MSRYKYQNDDKASLRNTKNCENTEDFCNSSKNSDKIFQFLKKIRADEYYKVFKDNEITFEDLQFLKENDILELGLPIGPRNRLIHAIENIENFQMEELEDENARSFQENSRKLKEIYQVSLAISQQQSEMLESIKKCQSDLIELKEDYKEDYCNRTSSTLRYQKDIDSSISPKFTRLSKPTLSSIAKQKVLPNKYMQVSPIRASYYSRLLN